MRLDPMQFLSFFFYLPVIFCVSTLSSSVSATETGNDREVRHEKINDIVRHVSLPGSYLAAQMAMANNDSQVAIPFLRKAFELDPDNNQIGQNLFLAYIADGQIREAVVLARDMDMTEDKTSGHIVPVVKGLEFIRKRSWNKAAKTFSGIKSELELDSLIAGVVSAWAKYGSGKTHVSLQQVSNFNVTRWMELIQLLHHGLILSASGKDKAAIGILQKAVAMRDIARFMGETYIDVVYALASARQRQGKGNEALADVERGLKIFPESSLLKATRKSLNSNKTIPLLVTNAQQGCAELFYNLGSVVGRNGNLHFSRIYLQLARWLDHEREPVVLSLAELYEKQGNFERANANYRQIGASSPYRHQALLETAINLNEMKDVKGAVRILQNLIGSTPSSLVTYMTLGRLLSQHERYHEAVDVFNRAIARIPDDERSQYWSYYYYRAVAFERLNEWESAEADFKKALELEPERAIVLNYLGYSWVDRGIHLKEGLELIRRAVSLNPEAGFIIDSLGWAYYRLGRYEDAVRELERAIAILPQDPVVNDHLGDAYWKTGRKLEARFQWRHALDAKPEEKEESRIRQKLQFGIIDVGQETLSKSNR